MSSYLEVANMVIYTSAITVVIIAIYQFFISKKLLCFLKKKLCEDPAAVKKCQPTEVPDCPQIADAMDVSDCSDGEGMTDKERIIKYYDLALQEYSRLNICEKMKNKKRNGSRTNVNY